MSRIKVFARIRQNLKGETGEKIKLLNDTSTQPQQQAKSPISPTVHGKPDNFDHIFESSRKPEEVYTACLSNMIGPLLEGYNVALVVFGESGSGQVKTVLGGEIGNILKSSKKNSGLLALLVNDLFMKKMEIENQNGDKITLKLTILEIKGNRITDLMILSNDSGAKETNGKINIA